MTSADSEAFIAQKNSTLPTRPDAFTADVKANPGIAGFQQILNVAQPRPALPEYSSLFTSLSTNLGKIAQNQQGIQSGLDASAQDYAKLLPDFTK